ENREAVGAPRPGRVHAPGSKPGAQKPAAATGGERAKLATLTGRSPGRPAGGTPRPVVLSPSPSLSPASSQEAAAAAARAASEAGLPRALKPAALGMRRRPPGLARPLPLKPVTPPRAAPPP